VARMLEPLGMNAQLEGGAGQRGRSWQSRLASPAFAATAAEAVAVARGELRSLARMEACGCGPRWSRDKSPIHELENQLPSARWSDARPGGEADHW